LCWIHSWFARKLLSRPFTFCYNPLAITKSFSATIGKSRRNSVPMCHMWNCTWTSQLNLPPRGPHLKNSPVRNAKTEALKGYNDNNFASVENTG
jgi:hypothetical protein